MRKNRGFNSIVLLTVSLVIFIILASMIYYEIIGEYYGSILVLSGIYIILALSLNLITGFTGQLALGQAGFMAIGAYTSAILAMRLNLPIFLAIIGGGLVSAFFGIIIGFPTLRLRGDYLAITTLGFGEIIRVLIINLEGLTGGASGLKGIPSLYQSDNFILNLVVNFTWVYSFVIIIIILVSNLIKSSPGRAIISIREDEIAANSMGINVPYYKMISFTFAAFIAGIGGALYAFYQGYLDPNMSGFLNSVNFVVIVVLGGMGSITGTILAGIAFTYIQELLRIFGDLRLVIFGLLLMLLMLFWQKGIMGTKEISIVNLVRKFLKFEGTSTNNSKEVKK